jgi:hypothetical protein
VICFIIANNYEQYVLRCKFFNQKDEYKLHVFLNVRDSEKYKKYMIYIAHDSIRMIFLMMNIFYMNRIYANNIQIITMYNSVS